MARAQDVLWLLAALLLWVTPWFTSTEGFVIAAEHFVERHGLVIIVALGESIVVVGAGAAGVPVDLRLVIVAASRACAERRPLVAVLSTRGGRRARHAWPPRRRDGRGLLSSAFGYWHYGLLLAVVAVAAGLKKAIGDPYDPLARLDRLELGVGVALFLWSTVGFCRTLGLGTSMTRLAAGAAALATIPIGTEWTAAAQLAALVTIVAVALVVEGQPQSFLAVVVEGELRRMRAQPHDVDLVLPLPRDPGLDELLREDSALEQELVIDLERVESL